LKTDEQKKKLRRELLTKRESLDPDVRKTHSRAICDAVQRWLTTTDAGRRVRWVACFLSHRGEPDLESLLLQGSSQGIKPPSSYQTVLPVVTKNAAGTPEMDFYLFHAGDPTVVNRFGIKEPFQDEKLRMPQAGRGETLVLVPALAVDNEGHRLGYGGGFYDRYLEKNPEAIALGVLFEEFRLRELPSEPHDRRLWGFITQKGMTLFQEIL